jgi:hypothetical protein
MTRRPFRYCADYDPNLPEADERGAPSEYAVTAARLRRASARKHEAEKARKQLGWLTVTDADLGAAATKRKQSHLAARASRSELLKLRARIFLATARGQAVAWAASVVVPGLLAGFCYLVSGKGGLSFLIGFLPAVLCTASLVIARATVVPRRKELPPLEKEAQVWQNRQAILLAEAQQAQARHEKLILARQWQDEYDESSREYERLLRIVQSERYKLLHTDWRSLRGIPFEEFVASVFESLGYSVEMTKASGDQGLDLIVTGHGWRLGVQCKGFVASVGNRSVQEAYTGKTFYRCSECMVVTNSAFTRGAIDVAGRVGCRLVDEAKIPALIKGAIVRPLSGTAEP